MSSNLLGELVANNGTYFLSIGQDYEGRVDQVIVRGSTIFDVELYITVEGSFVEVTNDYLGDKRIPNGLRITPKGDDVFTRVRCRNGEQPHEGFELVLA